MFALSNQYFSIPDSQARKLFLVAHTELQQWFVEQRTKRYEKFLNKESLRCRQRVESVAKGTGGERLHRPPSNGIGRRHRAA